MLANSTRPGLSNRPPLMLLAFNSTLTRFATVPEVFRIVTTASYGSPKRTVRGWVKAMLNFGLRTRMLPAALPVMVTAPAAKPSNFADNLRSITCRPSCKPSTNNSPWPVSPACRRSMSSLVPVLPSGPVARTGTMF